LKALQDKHLINQKSYNERKVLNLSEPQLLLQALKSHDKQMHAKGGQFFHVENF
jgi:hypothetical protein